MSDTERHSIRPDLVGVVATGSGYTRACDVFASESDQSVVLHLDEKRARALLAELFEVVSHWNEERPGCTWVVRHATTETPDEHCDLLVEVGDEYCPGHQSKADAMAEQERAEQEPEADTRQAERDKAAEAIGDEVRVLQLMDESGYSTPCGYSAAHSGSFEPVPATQIINCGPAVGDVPACDACAALYARLSGKGE